MELRVGIGSDAHALAAGRPLLLGGVAVPHTHGLAGHSDGDVLSHAIIDALLGAANLGDIGTHFPPGDPDLAGISSLILLQRCRALLDGPDGLDGLDGLDRSDRSNAAGWRIANVDATMLAQRPRLAPYIPTMRQRVAQALAITPQQVSIKATTTDYLGFTGREEGIAAVAVALLTRP